MMIKVAVVSSVCLLLGVLFLSPTPAFEEDDKDRFSYAAQVTCGTDPPAGILRIVPGQYATAIHIQNPTDVPITFRKRLALTFPDKDFGSAQKPGLVSEWIQDTLEPGEALEVDCGEMPGEFFPGVGFPPYIQSLLVINSPRSLDVTAVYTTASIDQDGNLSVQSIDVEEVRERRIKGR